MIDIHCHILPCIDDGSKSIDETLEMARIAVDEGIHHIIATPHYIQYSDYLNKQQVQKLVDEVNDVLKKENIALSLSIGQEIYLTPDLPKLVQSGEVSTLNDGQYILIEFPMNDIPLYAEDIFYELRLMGLTPILAHPERYPMVMEDPNLLLKFLKLGVLCQVNMGSIRGFFGERVQKTVMTLIEHDMVHFVATDAHTPRNRAPKMKKALEEITRLDGEKARKLFIENPLKVYNNELIETVPPREVQKLGFFRTLINKFIA